MKLTELLPKLTEEDKKYSQENVKSEKEAYNYLVSKGLTDSFEEFTAFLSQLKTLSSGEKELTDDQLKLIAGGWSLPIEDDGGGSGGSDNGGSVLDRLNEAWSSPTKYADFFGFYPGIMC